MAQGGQGAVDAFKAMALGLPPMTEAGRLYTATQQAGVAALRKYNDNANNASMTTQQAAAANRAALAKQISDGRSDREALQKVLQADALAGGKLSESFADATKLQTKFQGMTEQQIASELEKMAAEDQRAASEAANMDEAKKSMQQLVNAILPVVNWFANVLTPILKVLAPILTGITLALGAMKIAVLAVTAIEQLRAGIGRLAGGGGGAAAALPSVAGAGAGATGGGGGGFVSFIRALGRGLASLAPIAVPMIIGAGAVAAVIAILGAGVAAAVALIGLSLPVFAKGLKEIAEIDGMNLAKVALGIAALGPALVLFTGGSLIAGLGAIGTRITNFFSGGGPISQIKSAVTELVPVLPQMQAIGPALNNYANGILAFGKAVSTVDIAKAERLKEVMKGPGVLEGIGSAIKDVGAATAKLMTGTQGGQEKSGLELAALNNSMKELVRISKEISDFTKQTVEATKKLNGDHFA